MKWLMEPIAVAFAVVVVVAMIILLGGVYLRSTQPPPTPTPVPVETTLATEIPTTIPTAIPETEPPTPELTTLPPTPAPPHTYAAPATPIRDPSYYTLPYYSTVYDPRQNMPPVIFQQSYTFNFQYEAAVATVIKPPLIIDFAVSPGSSSPIRSFFLITIRNNETQRLLAQDGYFRTYSAQSPKRLIFSSPGTYHINMYGSFVSVSLTLRAPTWPPP